MSNVLDILMLVGITIILGYIGKMITERTKIPEILWLLLLGMITVHILNIEQKLFVMFLPLFSVVAIIFILFNAGLHMNIKNIAVGMPRAFVLAFVCFATSVLIITFFMNIVFNWPLLISALFGAILGGTSTPVVTRLVESRKTTNASDMLIIESIINDILCVVSAVVIIQIITTAAPQNIMQLFVSSLSVSIVMGVMAGIVCYSIIERVRMKHYEYIITLAVLFLVYVFTEANGANGPLASFVFGLVFGNSYLFSNALNIKQTFDIKRFIVYFHDEITFFISSFFFVYLGIMFVLPGVTYLLYAILLTLLMLTGRVLASSLVLYGSKLSVVEKNIVKSTFSRGLTAAALFGITVSSSIPDTEQFINIGIVIVVLSILINILLAWLSRKGGNNA